MSFHAGFDVAQVIHVNNESLWQIYNASYNRYVMLTQICSIGGGDAYTFVSESDELAQQCGGPLRDGEALLLHGTHPALVETVLKTGANESYTSNAMFGKGVYFAENCKTSSS